MNRRLFGKLKFVKLLLEYWISLGHFNRLWKWFIEPSLYIMKAIRDGNLMKEKSIIFVINYLWVFGWKWFSLILQVVDLVKFSIILLFAQQFI